MDYKYFQAKVVKMFRKIILVLLLVHYSKYVAAFIVADLFIALGKLEKNKKGG